jgi:tetratricopeptide (TPR) repeat protein
MARSGLSALVLLAGLAAPSTPAQESSPIVHFPRWQYHFECGSHLFEQQQYDRAMEEANAALDSAPRRLEGLFLRGCVFAAREEWDRAIADLTPVVEGKCHLSKALHWRCSALAGKGQVHLALADMDEALRLEQTGPMFRFRGNLRLGQGDFDGAIADFDMAIRLGPRDATAFNDRGRSYVYKGDMDRAYSDFDTAVRFAPDYPSALSNRGFCRIERGEIDAAFADLNEAIRLDPKNSTAYRNRGSAHLQRQEFDPAIADCTEALRLNPRNADALAFRGCALLKKREARAAVEDLTAAIELGHRDAEDFGSRGTGYLALGDVEGALGDLIEATRLDPNTESYFYNRACAYAAKGDLGRAIADLSEAIRLEPGNASSWEARGLFHLLGSESVAALADLTEALRLDPHNEQAFWGLAMLRAASPIDGLRDGPLALEMATAAYQRPGWDRHRAALALAAALAECGRFEEAARWQRRALDVATDQSAGARQEDLACLQLYEAGKPYRLLKHTPEQIRAIASFAPPPPAPRP